MCEKHVERGREGVHTIEKVIFERFNIRSFQLESNLRISVRRAVEHGGCGFHSTPHNPRVFSLCLLLVTIRKYFNSSKIPLHTI